MCPAAHAPQCETKAATDKEKGVGFLTATGKRVPNLGGREIAGTTDEGEQIKMNYSVADVSVALDSVSQICDSGATVVFKKDGGYIERTSGKRTHFKRERDTYVREVVVPRNGGDGSAGTVPFDRRT